MYMRLERAIYVECEMSPSAWDRIDNVRCSSISLVYRGLDARERERLWPMCTRVCLRGVLFLCIYGFETTTGSAVPVSVWTNRGVMFLLLGNLADAIGDAAERAHLC